MKALLRKVREIVKGNKTATDGHLIADLNPVIRGWANYHQHVVSKETFGRVDNVIHHVLWRWARRRHPEKTRWWVGNKYFHFDSGKRWTFFGEAAGRNGITQEVRLFKASSVPIKRHTKIKGEANPYDPAWELYFEARLGVKMVNDLRGRRQLLYLT